MQIQSTRKPIKKLKNWKSLNNYCMMKVFCLELLVWFFPIKIQGWQSFFMSIVFRWNVNCVFYYRLPSSYYCYVMNWRKARSGNPDAKGSQFQIKLIQYLMVIKCVKLVEKSDNQRNNISGRKRRTSSAISHDCMEWYRPPPGVALCPQVEGPRLNMTIKWLSHPFTVPSLCWLEGSFWGIF